MSERTVLEGISGRFVILIRSYVATNCSWEVKLLSPNRNWEVGLISFLMVTFKKEMGWLPFLGSTTSKRLGEDLHFQGAEKEFEIITFLQ